MGIFICLMLSQLLGGDTGSGIYIFFGAVIGTIVWAAEAFFNQSPNTVDGSEEFLAECVLDGRGEDVAFCSTCSKETPLSSISCIWCGAAITNR